MLEEGENNFKVLCDIK